jgi:hypothetical protein
MDRADMKLLFTISHGLTQHKLNLSLFYLDKLFQAKAQQRLRLELRPVLELQAAQVVQAVQVVQAAKVPLCLAAINL